MMRLLIVLPLSLLAVSWAGAQESAAGSPSGMERAHTDHSPSDRNPSATGHAHVEHAAPETARAPAGGGQDAGARAGASGHGGHDAAPQATAGSWSYHDRNNPRPQAAKDRWEMVPVPGYGHLYVSGKELSAELRCAAVRDNPRVMVDRATRKACGMPEIPTVRESRAGRAAPAGRIHAAETGSADPHAGH